MLNAAAAFAAQHTTAGAASRSATAAYGQQNRSLSPTQAVAALLRRMLADIGAARYRWEQREHDRAWRPGVHENLIHAKDIVTGLRTALDMESGGAVAEAMESTYLVVDQLLAQAIVAMDVSLTDPAADAIRTILEAWETVTGITAPVVGDPT
jgi:flagellar protein FliS